MRKYIDKINSYLKENEGTKKVKLLQFFVPLVSIIIIKLLFFTFDFFEESLSYFLTNCIQVSIFSVIFTFLICKHLDKKYNKLRNWLFLLFICLFPIVYYLIDTIFFLTSYIGSINGLYYILTVWFSVFVYSKSEKEKSWILFNSITDLKQSILGLIICILLDYFFYMLQFVWNAQYFSYTIHLRDYASFYHSYFYMIFVLWNIISYLEPYYKKYKDVLINKINLYIEVCEKYKNTKFLHGFLFLLFILFINFVLKEFNIENLDRAVRGIDVVLYTLYLNIFCVFLFFLINSNLKKRLKVNFNQKLFLVLYICFFTVFLHCIDIIIIILGVFKMTDEVSIILPVLIPVYFLLKNKK